MSEENNHPLQLTRVSERQKKQKTPFDPSFVQRRHTEYHVPVPVTKISAKDAVKSNCFHCKKFDKAETMVNCKGSCSVTIHLTCLRSNFDYFGENVEHTWKCDDCQLCSICKKGIINAKPLLKCYICFTYYHSQCFGAVDRGNIVKKNRFRCNTCVEKTKTTAAEIEKPNTIIRKQAPVNRRTARPKSVNVSTINEADFLGFNFSEIEESTANQPANSMKRHRSQSELHSPNMQPRSSVSDNANGIDNDTNIPDASQWSTSEVFEYFKCKFPKHAHAFEEEEIDGRSLYRLEREDVIRGFKIKIGPAIKIYDHILNMKKKINDSALQQQ